MDKKTQYIIIAIFAFVLLCIGAWCFKMNNPDKYVYDPLNEGLLVRPDPALMKFFEENGSDPEHRINDQRYLLACQGCDRTNPRLTPEACHQCDAYLKGMQRYTEGTL